MSKNRERGDYKVVLVIFLNDQESKSEVNRVARQMVESIDGVDTWSIDIIQWNGYCSYCDNNMHLDSLFVVDDEYYCKTCFDKLKAAFAEV